MVMVSSSNFLDLDLDKQKKIKLGFDLQGGSAVSYTHLRAHETS